LWAYLVVVGYAISKYDLMAIPVVIGRAVAFFITAAIFWVGYGGVCWVLNGGNFGHMSMGWWVVTGVYFLGGVAPFFRSVQTRLQTSAYRRFLNIRYDFDDLIQQTSRELVKATTREEVLRAIYQLQTNLDISDSHAIVRTDDGAFECLHITPVTQLRVPDVLMTLPIDHDLIRLLPHQAVMDSRRLDQVLQDWIRQLTHRRRTLVLAIHAFNHLEAVFLLGPKLSEEAYTKKDEALFHIVLNHATTVVERIEKTTVTQRLMTELEESNAQLEVKATAAIELAKQHFHQAAMASLSAGIAHEIRNPMAAILGSSEHLALSLGAMQDDVLTRPRRMTPDPLIKPSSDWLVPLTLGDVIPDVGGDESAAHAWYHFLVAHDWVDDRGMIRAHFDKALPLLTDDCPDGLRPYRPAIQLRLRWIHAMGLISQFLTVVSVQIPRILAITDTMMKYGVSGGGIHRYTFAKLDGIDNELSSGLFQVLIDNGYIDSNGCGLARLHDAHDDLLATIAAYLPDSLQHHAVSLAAWLHHIPGGCKRPVDLGQLLTQTVEMLAGECSKKGIRLHSIDPLQTVWVLGDEHRLQQAFLNLLLNAKQSMEKKPSPLSGHRLGIELQATPDDRVLVAVSDTGGGMTPDQQEKIFDPFFTTKSGAKSHNIGLGLSIVKEVILNHDGSIAVSSSLKEGTRFSVSLPMWHGS